MSTRLEDDSSQTTGYNAGVFIDTATPTEALVCTPIAGHGADVAPLRL